MVEIEELLQFLRNHCIDTSKLEVINGNDMYGETKILIKRVLDCWYKPPNALPTSNIYCSFLLLESYLESGNWRDKCFFGEDKCKDIIKLAEDIKESPKFFNSIILTGNIYKLEWPYGVSTDYNEKGNICIIRNVSKMSIWHETAHLLGAHDHYDNNQKPKKECKDPENCLMGWNKLQGNFCDKSLEEMKYFISNTFRS